MTVKTPMQSSFHYQMLYYTEMFVCTTSIKDMYDIEYLFNYRRFWHATYKKSLKYKFKNSLEVHLIYFYITANTKENYNSVSTNHKHRSNRILELNIFLINTVLKNGVTTFRYKCSFNTCLKIFLKHSFGIRSNFKST